MNESTIENYIQQIGLIQIEATNISDTFRDGVISKYTESLLKDLHGHLETLNDERITLQTLLFGNAIIPGHIWCAFRHACHRDVEFYDLIHDAPTLDRAKMLSELAHVHHYRLVDEAKEILKGKYDIPTKSKPITYQIFNPNRRRWLKIEVPSGIKTLKKSSGKWANIPVYKKGATK